MMTASTYHSTIENPSASWSRMAKTRPKAEIRFLKSQGEKVMRGQVKYEKSNSLASNRSDSSSTAPATALPSQQDVEQYKAKSGVRKSDSMTSASGNDTPTTTSGNLHEADAEGERGAEKKKGMPNLLSSNSRGSNGSTATLSGNGDVLISEVSMTDYCTELHCNTTGYPY
jgi:hypothetical protein